MVVCTVASNWLSLKIDVVRGYVLDYDPNKKWTPKPETGSLDFGVV